MVEKCPSSPLVPNKGHLFITDEDDKRFEVCQWCKAVEYRTDQKLLEEGKRTGEAELP